MIIKFCGANKEVTGSCHLVSVKKQKFLLDCGIFQGGDKTENTIDKNREFIFTPSKIQAVLLSHAHQDHAGRLPFLAKNGFTGKIHCTIPTIDLCRVMLADAAAIQKQDAEFYREHFKKEIEPLFNAHDVDLVMNQFVPHEYNEPFFLAPNIKVTFVEAGHVFGSAQIIIEIDDEGVKRRLIYTGDLGRKYLPILNDPEVISSGDILITESTYASHVHDSFNYVFDELKWIINDVVARGGKIIVPGFSLERTQEIVYVLHKLFLDKKIPALPIFVDSPLAIKVSRVFMKYSDYYDNQSFKDFLINGNSPFDFKHVKYLMTKPESQKLNHFSQPCIIIAGSGMCNGGRILHHLKNNVEDPRNLILVVGFMAKGTLGRRLVEKKREIKIFGEYFNLKSDVVALNEFSGHADKLELLEHIKAIKGLKQIFIVHGEELETSVMRDNIYNILKFKGRVDIPNFGEEYSIFDSRVESNIENKSQMYWQAWQESKDFESY